MRSVLYLSVAILLIFSSCKKEEEPVDPCMNGFLDPGEDGVDCGGTCAPCSSTPVSSLFITVNGIEVSMTTQDLNYDGSNWVLSMTNDSLNFSFDLGSNGTVGSYPLYAPGTSCIFNGVPYLNQDNGSCAINAHNTSEDIMSGFFQVDFSRTGFIDTIHVTSGQFDYFQY